MKHTKRFLALAFVMLVLTAFCFASCGGEKGPFVYVTVADENGKIVACYEKVEYTKGMTIDTALPRSTPKNARAVTPLPKARTGFLW